LREPCSRDGLVLALSALLGFAPSNPRPQERRDRHGHQDKSREHTDESGGAECASAKDQKRDADRREQGADERVDPQESTLTPRQLSPTFFAASSPVRPQCSSVDHSAIVG
jgi:hypothetical protein